MALADARAFYIGETMKYYIASSLENAEQVKRLIWLLKSWGWQVTYDWTKHGSVQAEGREVIKETAKKELAGGERGRLGDHPAAGWTWDTYRDGCSPGSG